MACNWGSWGDWGYCSVTCGQGVQERYRVYDVDAEFSWMNCTGTDEEVTKCSVGCVEPTVSPAVTRALIAAVIDVRSE